MPITVFRNENGILVNETKTLGLNSLTGWWKDIASMDLDNDGDLDFVCGNIGLNTGYTATNENPVRLYVVDLNQDGVYDSLMTHIQNGTEALQVSRDILFKRVPFLFRFFPNHSSFAGTSVQKLISVSGTEDFDVLDAAIFHSVALINENGRAFKIDTLPVMAQSLPIQAILAKDINADNRVDLILGGGFSSAEFDGRTYGANGYLAFYNTEEGLSYQDTTLEYINYDITSLTIVNLSQEKKVLLSGSNHGLKPILQWGK